MASNVQVRTVEVAVESSAGKALGNIDALIERLDVLAQTLQTVVTKAGGLATIGKSKGSSGGLKSTTKEVEKTSKAVSEMSSQVDKFIDKMTKTGFTGVEKSAKASYKAVKDYADEMKRFGVDTEQKGVKFLYQDDAKNVGNRFRSLNSGMSRADFMRRAAQGYKSPEGLGYADKMKEFAFSNIGAKMVDSLSNAATKAQTAFGAAKNALSGFASKAGGVLKSSLEVAKSSMHSVGNALSKMSGAFRSTLGVVKNVAIAIHKVWFKTMLRLPSAIKAAMHPLKLFSNAMKKVGGFLGIGGDHRGGLFSGRGGFGRFLGLMLLRRAILSVLRALVSGIKEGSDNLAKYSDAYNNSISSMRSALTYLKNAWAAAFAPIVNVVAPYINAFISMLASALNAIGRFLAALTGKGFAVQAKPVWQDYADSLGGAASGAGKASKAAKEYQKTLMSFDQIHALNSPDNGSGGSGGGGGGGGSDGLSVQDMFETVSIESSMMDFANKIREAIANGDWFGVGQIIAEKMNEAIEKALEKDAFRNFGKKVAEALNKAIDAFAGWATTFDFANLGKGIGQAIGSALMNIHWDNLGLGVGAWINGLWTLIGNAIDEVPWKDLGMKIRDGIVNFFDTMKWNEVRATLTKAFEALLDFISGLLEGDKLGQAIIQSIDEFFSDIKREDVIRVGAKIAKVIAQMLQFAMELTAKTSPLALFLNKVFGVEISTDMSALFQPLYDELDKLIAKNEKAGRSTDKIMEGYEGSAGESAKWLMQLKKETQKGAKEIQKEAAKTGKGVETSASTTGKNTVKTTSKTTKEVSRELRSGASAVGTSSDVLLEPLIRAFNWIVQKATSTGVDVPTEMARSTSFYATYVYGAAQGLMDKYGGGIRDKIDHVKGKAKEIYDKVKSTIDVPAPFKSIGEKITNFLGDGLGSGTSTKSKLTTAANNVVEAIKKAFGGGNTSAVYNTGHSLGQAVVRGVNDGIRSLGIAKIEYKLKYDTVNGNRVATGLNPTKSYVQLAAEGGFLRSGEMFIARERGPEMVGRIGNRNAVANNQQIIEGIESGVAKGVLAAMAASNGNNSAPYEFHITVKTQNDEVLARAVERGNAQRRYRLGTAMG